MISLSSSLGRAFRQFRDLIDEFEAEIERLTDALGKAECENGELRDRIGDLEDQIKELTS